MAPFTVGKEEMACMMVDCILLWPCTSLVTGLGTGTSSRPAIAYIYKMAAFFLVSSSNPLMSMVTLGSSCNLNPYFRFRMLLR